MARQLDLSKQQRWLSLLKRWANSWLTVRDFCEQHGLTETSFYFWRRTLRGRGLFSDSTTSNTPSASAPFVQLTVAPPAPASTIDIVLGNERRLQVRPGFDAQTLRQLVRLLEEPAIASEVPPC